MQKVYLNVLILIFTHFISVYFRKEKTTTSLENQKHHHTQNVELSTKWSTGPVTQLLADCRNYRWHAAVIIKQRYSGLPLIHRVNLGRPTIENLILQDAIQLFKKDEKEQVKNAVAEVVSALRTHGRERIPAVYQTIITSEE